MESATTSIPVQEGGDIMDYIITLILSILAGIISHYICQWLDRKHEGSQPED
jgi:uncharacterized membrane protein